LVDTKKVLPSILQNHREMAVNFSLLNDLPKKMHTQIIYIAHNTMENLNRGISETTGFSGADPEVVFAPCHGGDLTARIKGPPGHRRTPLTLPSGRRRGTCRPPGGPHAPRPPSPHPPPTPRRPRLDAPGNPPSSIRSGIALDCYPPLAPSPPSPTRTHTDTH